MLEDGSMVMFSSPEIIRLVKSMPCPQQIIAAKIRILLGEYWKQEIELKVWAHYIGHSRPRNVHFKENARLW